MFQSYGGLGSNLGAGNSQPMGLNPVGAVKDYEIPQVPGQPAMDGISGLAFSPVADFLAASSWDGAIRCWQTQLQSEAVLKATLQMQGPSLCCAWSTDGTKLFGGSVDKQVKMLDLNTGQQMQVAQHDAPVSCVKFVNHPQGQLLITGSWDKTVKYWDARSPTPAITVPLPERCYSMDLKYPAFVVATAERKFLIYNLENPTVVFKLLDENSKPSPAPLKYQTRVVSCFTVGDGFAIGSIEGRVAIQYLQEKEQQSNFSFKCHREGGGQAGTNKTESSQIYAVNAISFHPTYGTFSTAGSDGTFNFWDKDSKQRLKTFPKMPTSISATAFNRTGNIFAYSVSYDWSKGYEHYNPNLMKNSIFLHPVSDDEIKNRPKNKN